ncbi:MAG: M23 family metallopeptidase [Sphingomonadaceae bacterium]|nr:MAG: M23 family metallopeptidase [Sphingomonadaceae bacterium]
MQMAWSILSTAGGVLLLASCTAGTVDAGEVTAADRIAWPTTAQPAQTTPPPPPMPVDTTLSYDGEMEQGGWLRGQAPAGAQSVRLDDEELTLSPKGTFFAAFDRDAGSSATLEVTLADGRKISRQLTIAPRDWQIERVNVARTNGGITEAFWQRRKPELDRIAAARAVNADTPGWTQDFMWPVKGRISGRFGAQRIYRGEPGSYHSGIDIAPGNGTPFVAPADGVVTLATDTPFSLEGYLLVIDHGAGLNSAFLHLSKIAVREGDRVTKGQYLGNVGSSGRASGPHLHWSLKWRDARLDPLLFAGPMN